MWNQAEFMRSEYKNKNYSGRKLEKKSWLFYYNNGYVPSTK